jgi:electron transfer flavoprotein beta subunit
MNPFDELSVEESVRIREKKRAPGGVEDICVLSAGPPKAQDILRTAMAMGADRAIHVEVKDGDDLEPLTVAKLLKAAAEQQKSNLVILGKQSIDDDANQTGQMLAGLLGWSQATQASKVEFHEGDSVSVTREVDGGVETVRAKLPLVITTDLRLNEPRYASLPNIMKAKKKPLEKKTLADFGISADKRLKVLKVTGELRTCEAQLICRGELLTWAVMQNPLRGKAAARWRTWMGSFPSSKSSALSRGLYANELSIYLANRLAAWCIVYTVLSKSVKVPCHMRPPHGPLIDVQHGPY